MSLLDDTPLPGQKRKDSGNVLELRVSMLEYEMREIKTIKRVVYMTLVAVLIQAMGILAVAGPKFGEALEHVASIQRQVNSLERRVERNEGFRFSP